jgi:hypothetical protein
MANPFVQYDNVVCIVAPVDTASTALVSPYVDLRTAQKAFFLVQFGAITSTTTTDYYLITVEAATAEGGAEALIPFRYRLSGAVGANTWGAVTSCASTGYTGLTAAAGDDIGILIEVDPDELATNDYRYARVLVTDTPDMEAGLVTVFAILENRYKQTTYTSATASASA